MILLGFGFFLTWLCSPAYAYLDPGTGSMIASALMALLATAVFVLKGLYYKGLGGICSLFGRTVKANAGQDCLVLYSEGRQYWNTFKPVLDEFIRRKRFCTYLTSDVKDPGLLCTSEWVTTKHIGTGAQAHRYLSFLEADICVMTTPGLDVLQIKRSKGVKHYAHLIHAPTDAANYKLYSFDYYDSVFASGEHQVRSIKKLEELRGTRPKLLVNAGCLYYDEMKRRSNKYPSRKASKRTLTVLVAPTWGANGLLKKSGLPLLLSLLKNGYDVILRPHPQSFISDTSLLIDLQEQLRPYANLEWDQQLDGMQSMAKADVMISDVSGAAFDFAFVFEKPVMSMKSEFHKAGLEAADLPWDPWELTALHHIGRQIDETDFSRLPEILEQEILRKDAKILIRQLRENSVSNFSCAAQHVVNELALIQERIQSRQASEIKSSPVVQMPSSQVH